MKIISPEFETTFYSLLFTLLLIAIAFGVAQIFLPNEISIGVEKYIFIWLVWDALIHFILEGPFVYMSIFGRTVATSSGPLAELWKEYGKADSRWLIAEPTVVSIEIPTFIICGPLALFVLWALIYDHPSRHPAQMFLCTCELYGGWMTWVPEILSGANALATHNPLYFWVYMVLFNGLWVLVPTLLLSHSWVELVKGAQLLKRQKENPKFKSQ
ncbi:hypothetical protein G9A89_009170 [Geosiphon pyriformis]|nr:hypothetical protein G9A89_009170 [Geosiphon pyriformis]